MALIYSVPNKHTPNGVCWIYFRERLIPIGSLHRFHKNIYERFNMVITYARVSTARQGLSIDNQICKLRQYVKTAGYGQAIEIIDEAVSGKSSKRKGYTEMLELIKSKKIDTVITYSLSRFSRNTRDTLSAVELMNRNNVKFISLKEDLDTSSPLGKFFITTMSAINALERDTIAERIKDVLHYKKSLNLCVGQIPFGKKAVGKNLADDRTEKYTIGLVKKLRQQKLSYKKIAIELVKRNRKNKNGNIKWNETQVRRILLSK